ncbi:glycosyltransferase family 4 protein [Candidatus Gottesmanbacteria bacterium]|nr:glycosyltransferase family 4 protein [Candidatus Gottesmanbacteria bacterium]
MKILILNWRDINNPTHGGAEVLTHELARRWVHLGHRVKLITSGFPGAKRHEVIDGVEISRYGRWWNIHLIAFFLYAAGAGKRTDVIVDEVHWFPFFSVLYAKKKVILLVCEVATRLFHQIFPHPVARFWQIIERIYFRLYRGVPVLAISSSTKQALVECGFSDDTITVIPMGISLPAILPKEQKEKLPTLIFVGRIHELKGIEDALRAFAILHLRAVANKFWIVGTGEATYVSSVKALAQRLGVSRSVQFFGRVSEEKKFALLSRAQVLIVPSLQEGWGLVVPEAGIVGTPAVGYDVAGLRDVIDNGKTGLLVRNHKPEALAKAVERVFREATMYKKLQKEAGKRARKASWDQAAIETLRQLKHRL